MENELHSELIELGQKALSMLDKQNVRHGYYSVAEAFGYWFVRIPAGDSHGMEWNLWILNPTVRKSITQPFPPVYYFSDDLEQHEYIRDSHWEIPQWAIYAGVIKYNGGF